MGIGKIHSSTWGFPIFLGKGNLDFLAEPQAGKWHEIFQENIVTSQFGVPAKGHAVDGSEIRRSPPGMYEIV